MALALVFLILVVFFGSLLIPLVILPAVPLTTVGAFGALYLTNTVLSVPSLLGILLLIGVVVSNAILLVDFAIKARVRYETPDEAVLAAGQARLRPILMTAFATVFALLPLALGLSGGGNELISSSLAITVVGGLATSTFLTLLVVPAGYSLLKSGLRRKKKFLAVGAEARNRRKGAALQPLAAGYAWRVSLRAEEGRRVVLAFHLQGTAQTARETNRASHLDPEEVLIASDRPLYRPSGLLDSSEPDT